MKKNHEKTIYKEVAIIILGGIGLFIATIIMHAVVSSPPSRAEFDALRVQSLEVNKSVDKRLETIENGQLNIIQILTRR